MPYAQATTDCQRDAQRHPCAGPIVNSALFRGAHHSAAWLGRHSAGFGALESLAAGTGIVGETVDYLCLGLAAICVLLDPEVKASCPSCLRSWHRRSDDVRRWGHRARTHRCLRGNGRQPTLPEASFSCCFVFFFRLTCERSKRMRRFLSVLLVTAVLLTMLAACAPAVAPSSAPAGQDAGTTGQEVVPAEGSTTTLTVWDTWTRDEESAVMEALIADFEAAHPGVTIDRVVKSFDDLKATTKLAMSADDGPDVAQVNQGWSDMGAMVQGGLLAPLTSYAEEYGWTDKISPGIAARNSYSEDGKTFGEGMLYGMPPTAELVGVFYRKDIFDELGLSVPTTFAEFEATLEQLKAAGYVPLTFGNTDGWPAGQTLGEILGTQLPDRAYLDDLVYSWGRGASWNSPETIAAAAKLVEWADKGYFTPGFEGIGYDDSTNLFNNGEGAMMLTGSWMSSTFQAGPHGANIGFFLVPPAEEGGFKMSTGGTSLAYAIRASSPNKELAAEFIDSVMSDQAASAWVASGTVPVAAVDPAGLEQGTLFADLVTAWQSMNSRDEVGHYLDWASPTFYDTLTAALQELLGKQITPEEFVQKLDADHKAFLEQMGK
jgi:raffinose/stachyose/melibiose transport system substrate-binding protein